MKRAAWTMLLVLAAAAFPAPASAELPDGEAVMDRLTAVFREMQDLNCDVAVHTAERQSSGSIVLQYLKERPAGPEREERVTRRYIVVTQTSVDGRRVRLKQLNDGQYLWQELTVVDTGAVKVSRRKVDPEGPIPGGFGPDWRREIDLWRGKYAFRTLRVETFDEEPVAVVRGTRRSTATDADAQKHPDLTLPESLVIFVSTRDWFPRKVDLFTAAAEDPATQQQIPSASVRLTHVRLNKGLDPDTFIYVVPQGAELILYK